MAASSVPSSREGADVHLVDHAAGQLATGPALVGPGEGEGVVGPRPAVHAVGLAPRPRVGADLAGAVELVAVVELAHAELPRVAGGQRAVDGPPALVVAGHGHGGRGAADGADVQGHRAGHGGPDGELRDAHGALLLVRKEFVAGQVAAYVGAEAIGDRRGGGGGSCAGSGVRVRARSRRARAPARGRCRTPARRRRAPRGPARARRRPSPSRGWSAPACAWSTARAGPSPQPRPKPACSMSQAALVLTRPSGWA